MARKFSSCISTKIRNKFFALNRQFTPGTEQDAHEFLSCLLSNLHDGLNRVYPVKIVKIKMIRKTRNQKITIKIILKKTSMNI